MDRYIHGTDQHDMHVVDYFRWCNWEDEQHDSHVGWFMWHRGFACQPVTLGWPERGQ